MSENSKYLTDASLARLAKWLRLLGYDTVVFPRAAGRDLLNLAIAEKRIVLTRRFDMLERQFSGELYFVAGIDIASQLAEVIAKFSLTVDQKKIFRLCLNCNERLFPVTKEEVYSLVPSYVFTNCSEYNKCPSCLRIYWNGTHQRNALRFLKKISNLPEKQQE
ncbi:MAG: hypothetical protein CVU52_11735 [Deltaproteobacteria bacterium HGW-Deltaproteobacteria-10]|nr:MAG: hypothetical protein CVU52_11735 [Deltaproteobacteria bacterium HGW-Deltaproteobacteria-10]